MIQIIKNVLCAVLRIIIPFLTSFILFIIVCVATGVDINKSIYGVLSIAILLGISAAFSGYKLGLISMGKVPWYFILYTT